MMELARNVEVPTGNILVGKTDKGFLEFLSIGDYGQDVNLNQHKRVDHGPMLPLEKKWVVTISTQYGCSMGCSFCDVPRVGPGKNATFHDMMGQINHAIALHPEVEYTERFNLHFARMGEPTFNPDVIGVAYAMKNFGDACSFKVHPVVSTMMPARNVGLQAFLHHWLHIKNDVYSGDAGLQLSINSTNDQARLSMFNGNAMELGDISNMMRHLPQPKGRKITLNFAVADYEIDAERLVRLFDPGKFVVKLTPMHKTTSATLRGIRTAGDYTEHYAYEHHEEALRAVGFDVLVFIASHEEDLGRITCGNAILSGMSRAEQNKASVAE